MTKVRAILHRSLSVPPTACLLGLVLLVCCALAPAVVGAAKATDELPPEIIRFIKSKEDHAEALARQLKVTVAPKVWDFIKSASKVSPTATTNAFGRLKKGAAQYEGSTNEAGVSTPVWQIAIEIELAVDPFAEGDARYAMAFGRGVVSSVPPGSIYFGGTDPGRGMPTAMSRSHAKGDPFFTITQNALVDSTYIEYIRATYGEKIRTPTAEDSQKAFQEYLNDAQKRLEHDRKFPTEPRQIKPGEDVRIVDNRVQVSGQVAVMAINGLLAKRIFDTNPDRDFYIEESFPLDWMYPHLAPHGFVFRLHRAPLDSLSDEALAEDRRFWLEQQKRTIGAWLTPDTTIKEICDYVRKTSVRKDYSGFEGDRHFVENAYANKCYSKLRSSIAGLYAWRAAHTRTDAERKRMLTEADFAFRQAFALCPRSPEAVFRYVNLLITDKRLIDARSIGLTARACDPENQQIEGLVTELDRMRRVGQSE